MTVSLDTVVDIAVRIGLLVAFTYAVVSCLRRSAALRHAVWTASLVMLFVVPWLPRAMPELTIASIPSLLHDHDDEASSSRALPLGLTSAYRRVERQAPIAAPIRTERRDEHSPGADAFAMAVLIVWIAGVTVVLARAGNHFARIRHITEEAADTSPIAHQAERIARSTAIALRLGRAVRIAWSGEVTGPLTWGVRRPFVILPSSSTNWTEARLKAVLRHELAHVQRFDYVALWLGHVATAVFWWHPAVWLAVRSAARECERACDDAAIHLGLSMYDYAHHLIAIAREYAIGPLRPSAVGMADGWALRDRVRRIMSPTTDRRPLTRRGLGFAWALAAVVALPLVVVQTDPRIIPVSELVEQLETGEQVARSRAAWRLGEREDPEAVPALMAAMTDPDAAVRGLAAWALGEIKDQRALATLERGLRDADPFVREMSVLAVGELENARSILPLRAVFDEQPSLRPAVLWAFEQIDDRSNGNAAQRVRETHPRLLRWDDGERTRVDPMWLEGTPRSAETVQLLLGELEDPDPTVRRDAAWALGRAGTAEAVDALIAALRDPDPRVRGVVVWALDEINPSRR